MAARRPLKHDSGMDTAFLRSSMPLCAMLGIELGTAGPDEVRLTMEWRPELCTAAGLLHGGAVMALADTSGALCAFLNLPEGANTATIESKTNFLRGVTEGAVDTVSRPLHAGASTIVVETEVRRGDGKLVAKTTQTQAVITR
jgi:1,4-dihydroxy-2-naphthoyl-CoA hydrolase